MAISISYVCDVKVTEKETELVLIDQLVDDACVITALMSSLPFLMLVVGECGRAS